jgi:intracellular septation protein
MDTPAPADPVRPKLSGVLKLGVDLGPLLVFFLGNKFGGLFVATALFMVATMVAMALSWWKTRHIPAMLLLVGVIVAVFGGLTLWLQDETFIKLKPTIIYASFSAILFFGLARGRSYLQLILGDALPGLSGVGWIKLTRNWALFFLALVGANEVARQVLTTDQWVNFKVWGVTAASLVFAMTQAPLMMRHGLTDPAKKDLPPMAD